MSIQSNVGAQAAAEEIARFIDELMERPNFEKMAPVALAALIQAKAKEIAEAARQGWY